MNGNIAVGALQGLNLSVQNAGTADEFTQFSSGTILVSNFADSVETDAADLLAGGFYFNVHSEANPAGELRGQLIPTGIQATRSELQASQEPQGSDTSANPDAAGVAFVTIDERNTLDPSVRINARVSGFTPLLPGDPGVGPLHLHRGFGWCEWQHCCRCFARFKSKCSKCWYSG